MKPWSGQTFAYPGASVSYWRDGADEIDFVVVQGKQVYGVEVKSGQRTAARGRVPFLKQNPKALLSLVTWDNYPHFAADPMGFLEKTALPG